MKIKGRLLFVIFVLFSFNLFSFNLFSSECSESEKDLIYKTLDARLQTRLCKNEEDAILFMEKYFDSILDQLYSPSIVSDEVFLALENMVNLEIYNYMYQKNISSSELSDFILPQFYKNEKYNESHLEKKMNEWYCLSYGDVLNSSMQFLSQSTAIKLGLREKESYDEIVNEKPFFSFARINRGLWYYFAPAIGGGSKKTALEDFSMALQCAACDYESFYSRVYLSQMYYEEKKIELCESLLNECDEILQGNVYIPFIRFLNDNGYSLLYYTNNREKVEKKLGI